MNLKKTIGIASLVVALPFFNATVSNFTVYTPKTSERLETHLKFSHGFYSSVQFMSHDIVRQSQGLYTIINNTVFMLSFHKNYEFLNENKNTPKIVELNTKDYLNNINIIRINEKNNTIYLSKRFKYEEIDNVEVYGKMGFW